MRILLGWLLLLTAFGCAWFVQQRWSEDLRRERAWRARARPEISRPNLAPTGRARLELGRPSGAEALDVPLRRHRPKELPPEGPGRLPALTTAAELAATWPEGEAPPSWSPPVYELRIPAGAVLSQICQDFYGTGRPPIPQRVAEYNGLKSADHLRAGERLRLPPLAELGL
jgi:hypothetical protein